MSALNKIVRWKKTLAMLAIFSGGFLYLAWPSTLTVDGVMDAHLASSAVATEARLAELDPANLPADIDVLVAAATEARLAELDAANLPAVTDSTLAEVIEIETHLHSGSDCFGIAATPAGTTHHADEWGAGAAGAEAGPLVVDAGNDDWGTWTQILGSGDTPHRTAMTKFDFHQILITDTETASVLYGAQLSFTALAPADDPTTAGTYSSFNFVSEAASPVAVKPSIKLQVPRAAAGTNVWMRTRVPNTDTSTMSFLFCIHEYIL